MGAWNVDGSAIQYSTSGGKECSWLNHGFRNDAVASVHVDQNEVE